MNLRRIGLFKALAQLRGDARAAQVAEGWRTALRGRPELVADLAALGFLDEPAVRFRQGRPAPLPADELQYREGARSVARAILDRAGLTHEETMQAIEELASDG